MQPGEVLGPMRGPSGFQLLQLVEVRDAQNAGSVTQYQARHILIRSGEVEGQELRFRTGAGIVIDSDPQRELDETRAKARGMLRALGVE